jgi:deltex-like protein
LPGTAGGFLLLKRLEYAFSRGLTFTVGTSLTTGETNVVTWSSIPHKTLLSEGKFGYPDDRYFYVCNGQLDALAVPSAMML